MSAGEKETGVETLDATDMETTPACKEGDQLRETRIIQAYEQNVEVHVKEAFKTHVVIPMQEVLNQQLLAAMDLITSLNVHTQKDVKRVKVRSLFPFSMVLSTPSSHF